MQISLNEKSVRNLLEHVYIESKKPTKHAANDKFVFNNNTVQLIFFNAQQLFLS